MSRFPAWFKLDPEAEAIIDSLRSQPERWAVDATYLYLNTVDKDYSFIHGLTGLFPGWMSPIHIWIANGASYVRLNGAPRWNSFSRRKLWLAYKQWKRLPRASGDSPVQRLLAIYGGNFTTGGSKVLRFPPPPNRRER